MRRTYQPPQLDAAQLAAQAAADAKALRKQKILNIIYWTLGIIFGVPLAVFVFCFPAVVMVLMVFLFPIVAILAAALGIGSKVKNHNNKWF